MLMDNRGTESRRRAVPGKTPAKKMHSVKSAPEKNAIARSKNKNLKGNAYG